MERDYFAGFKTGLDSKEIKRISEEVIEFIKEKTQSKKVWVINFVLDQAKADVTVENRLKHDPRKWQTDPTIDEC